jgi:hypothetical protein
MGDIISLRPNHTLGQELNSSKIDANTQLTLATAISAANYVDKNVVPPTTKQSMNAKLIS